MALGWPGWLIAIRLGGLAVIALFHGPPAWLAGQSPTLDVTFVANEGVLIRTPQSRVLIDAIFGSGLESYGAAPPAMRTALEKARPPFDEVDLVLATQMRSWNTWDRTRARSSSPPARR
jgi:hypothetical protein